MLRFARRVDTPKCAMTSRCFRISSFLFRCVLMASYSNAIYHTEQQKSLKSYSKNAIGVKKSSKKKGHFAHRSIGNEIKICSQNKCHHHLSKVCENSFRMFHSNWAISDYHSFVWQFEFPWLNLTNCPYIYMRADIGLQIESTKYRLLNDSVDIESSIRFHLLVTVSNTLLSGRE